MSIYQFNLTPQDAYFFGDERSFGSGENTNYFVKSRPWPQQSTLLGMLRYELLRRQGLLTLHGIKQSIKEKKQAIELIGEKSFSPIGNHSYGKIRKLSPVWLANEGQVYVMPPLNKNLQEDSPSGNGTEDQTLSLQSKRSKPIVKFRAKKSSPCVELYNLTSGQTRCMDEALVEREQVGITKSTGMEEDSDGFYRQLRYKLRPGWTFCFIAEIEDEELPYNFEKMPVSQIPVGGEKLSFGLRATKLAEMPVLMTPPEPDTSQEFLQLHLLSDAYVKDMPALLAACAYACIGDPVDFRSIHTAVEQTAEYHNLTRRGGKAVAGRASFSALYQLIPRGSVLKLRTANWDAVSGMLNEAKNWQQIGYNSYQIL